MGLGEKSRLIPKKNKNIPGPGSYKLAAYQSI